MKFLLDHLEAQRQGLESPYRLSALQRAYGCRCSRAVFFCNTRCLSCDTPLGYEPQSGCVVALEPSSSPGAWRLAEGSGFHGEDVFYKRCANLDTAAACNWLLPVQDQNSFCAACRLNRTIPDISVAENAVFWGRLEEAKRRVVSALIALGLPVKSRVNEDPDEGLAFDFLVSLPNGPRVLTGHSDGVITINIEEADPVKREQARTSMHEPYRTLVGHFRHEVGHYYWDRLVANSQWLAQFRELFGDERLDYAAALKTNYETGPRPDWPRNYVSAYASIHPWEDWAETWAHYMHMVDTLGTAMSFGLNPEHIAMPFDAFETDVLYRQHGADAERFLSFLNAWIKLTAVMNELCRSMGQADFYPFALPRPAVTKLHFVHTLVCDASTRCGESKQEAA